MLFGILPLAACLGRFHAGSTPAPATTESGISFACDPTASALTAAPVKRMAKVYVENSIREFVSGFSATSQTTLLSVIQSRFDLIPDDQIPSTAGGAYYSVDDATLAQEHVDNIVYLGLSLATSITGNPTYVSDMLNVCGPGLDKTALLGDACLTSFVQYYGRKAFRRPLADAETTDFKSFFTQVNSAGLDGFTALIARFISHPYFYYRIDEDGTLLSGTEGTDAIYQLTKWELLSKITFLFWQAPPTDALYDLVESLDITTDENLSTILDSILADPKAQQGILGFYSEWLKLEQTLIPGSTGNIMAIATQVADDGLDAVPPTQKDDMNQEILDLVNHYSLATDGRFEDILVSPYSFAKTPALAKIYGVDAWDGTAGNLVSFPVGERSGLLTRAAFVASNTEYTRPVIKGKLIRTQILCEDIPPPPPGVNIKPLVHMPGETTREATSEVTADTTCTTCHQPMDALGFATENYDPLGRIRQIELDFTDGQGMPSGQAQIDTSVTPMLTDGDMSSAKDGVELSQKIADSGLAHLCLVRNYFRYVNGRQEDDSADGCDLESMRKKLMNAGGSVKQMLKQTILQSSFRQKKVG